MRTALHQLPKTLYETYDQRITNDIPEQYRREAYHAMQLMAVSYRPLAVAELAEAIVIDGDKLKFDPQDRLWDCYDILEICSNLITVTVSGFVVPIPISDCKGGRGSPAVCSLLCERVYRLWLCIAKYFPRVRGFCFSQSPACVKNISRISALLWGPRLARTNSDDSLQNVPFSSLRLAVLARAL